MTRNKAITLLVAALLLTGLVGTSHGQYYGYWYNYAPGYSVPAPQPGPSAAPSNPLLYRLAPDPMLYRRWDNQIRIWDFLERQRGALEQETTLDYLMRTF